MEGSTKQQSILTRQVNSLERNPIGFNIIAYGIVGFMALMGVLPFWMLVAGSLTDNATIVREGFSLWPSTWSLAAYRVLFAAPQRLLRAYGVTIGITVVGTFLVVVFMAMTSYALSRQEFKYRNYFAFFFYFPALFSGGIVPFYLLMLNLGMRNSYWAMILPSLGSFFFIIILRSYFVSLPAEIGESGKMDGAGEMTICFKLYMPMAIPALATVGLFAALGFWGEWFNAQLFIANQDMIPLQLWLRRVLLTEQAAHDAMHGAGIGMRDVPGEALRLAMVCLATGPIIFAFPFIQKYFMRGLTIGAVKG